MAGATPGLIVGWFVFVPVHRLKQKVICFIDYENKKVNFLVNVLKKVDIFNLIQFNDIKMMTAIVESKLETSLTSMVAYGDGSPDINDNFYAIRRVMWVTPLLWPVMCVLYLPLITTGCRLLFNYTVNAE